jgi:peptide/nickel transport system permease protein
MIRYILVRLLQAVPALLGVSFVAFVLVQASGDMTYVLLPQQATEEQRAEFRRIYGLDQPIPVQYVRYLSHMVQGDFGRSFVYGRPAMEVVLDRFPATFQLTMVAMIIGVGVAIPAGVLSAVKRNSLGDRFLTVMVLVAQAMPTFWTGMLLILIFAVHFHIFPASGRGTPAHIILPGLALSTWPLALTARLTRSGMLEALGQEYVLTARAKGVKEVKVAWNHALRNALLPIVTIIGINFGGMLGGAVLTETVFAWPGIGTLVQASILARDYPVVLSALIFVATLFVLISVGVDILYGFLDPRIRTAHGH